MGNLPEIKNLVSCILYLVMRVCLSIKSSNTIKMFMYICEYCALWTQRKVNKCRLEDMRVC